MPAWKAALLGLVQGVTEFLPVSSDGHLAVFQSLLKTDPQQALAMDVALHLGTLGSILVFFRHDLLRLAGAVKSSSPERRRILFIFLACLPTGVIGLALKGVVESHAASMAAAGLGLCGTAVVLFIGEGALRRGGVRAWETLPPWHALIIGVAQGLAVLPGLSRSGTTIVTAMLLGWKWDNAARFSFLAALPAVAGAALLTAKDIASLDVGPALLGLVVAFVAGLASLRLLMRFLAARRLWPFAAYCALLGAWALSRGLLN